MWHDQAGIGGSDPIGTARRRSPRSAAAGPLFGWLAGIHRCLMAARSDELTRFVREALQRDIPRPEIEQALHDAGWQPEQVKKALASFAEIPFPVPVPRPVLQVSAGEAFRYLVLFTALGITAFSVVGLFFTLIDYLFYDPAAMPLGPDMWVPGVLWVVARVIIPSRSSSSPRGSLADH